MHALLSILPEAGTNSALAWLLWIVLGLFVLAILVGWGTSLSRLKQDAVREEAKAPARRTVAKQPKESTVRSKARPAAKSSRRTK